MSNYALEVNGISKKYDGFSLKEIDIKLEKGTVMGLVGQNGAGKTTLINLIMNKIRNDGGEIKVFGFDNIADEPKVKNLIGYVADEEYMYFGFTLEKYRKIFSMAYDKWNGDLFDSLCKKFDLPLKKKFSEFSKGMKTKAMLALALAHEPELMLMDEPTAGLDPVARIEILDMLREFVSDGEKAVLFSTHITSDLDKIADYITLIIDGEIVESMSIDMVEEKYAVVTGSGKPSDSDSKYLIGIRQGSSSYTALAKREDVKKLGNVSVHTPDIENLLTHNIWHKKNGKGA
ncbi:MAG: ABC transporter ATP-binding protein [Oscillospiraceae bacterium]|nr:ABC transporter ATP-binding protein [Oscillospiraceae bacterium]